MCNCEESASRFYAICENDDVNILTKVLNKVLDLYEDNIDSIKDARSIVDTMEIKYRKIMLDILSMHGVSNEQE